MQPTRPISSRRPYVIFGIVIVALAGLVIAFVAGGLGSTSRTAVSGASAPAAPGAGGAAVGVVPPSDAEAGSDSGVADESAVSGEADSPGPGGTPSSILFTVDPAWATATATATGIPVRALQSYAAAEYSAGQEFPGCGLGWNTVAAIGWVESHHGALGGGALDDDGVVRPSIIGIPLDGTSTLAVPDTDGGALDGDDEWDRAVGPLQFIPSTWASFGADGNGDGVIDVHNLDDAALSAARYLCSTGGDLREPQAWIDAVHSYNPSLDYNNQVAEAANTYAGQAGG